MQLYTIITTFLEIIGIAISAAILISILTYFTKEFIKNFKGKNSKYYYDSPKEVQRKIGKERKKLDRVLKKK